MLPVIFPLISSDSDVAAMIGDRFYRHGHAPQNVVAPYCTWFVVSGLPENALDELPRVDRFSVQIDCWSNNTGTGDEEVETLARAIRDAIEPHAHMTGVVVDGVDPDTKRNRIGLQFTFWEDREVIS